MKLQDKTEYARSNIDSTEYKSEIQEIEDQLHDLRSDLADKEVEILQDLGYKPINIDDLKIMTPVGMSFQQLYTSLQQAATPDEQTDRAFKLLVSEEDRSKVRDNAEYQDIVEDRRDLVDEIFDIYVDFWEQEVKPVAEDDTESIVYMIAGLDRNISSDKLSKITGISKYKCRKYSLNDGVVERNIHRV